MGLFVQYVHQHSVAITHMEATLLSHMAAIISMLHLILSIPLSTDCGNVHIRRLGVMVLL
jgi:hypothetical protein